MTESPTPDAPEALARIVLSRDGAEAVVRVGDVVPMDNGESGVVREVDIGGVIPSVRVTVGDMKSGIWHYKDGQANVSDHPHIDVAALASAAATPAPARHDAEAMRELVAAAEDYNLALNMHASDAFLRWGRVQRAIAALPPKERADG